MDGNLYIYLCVVVVYAGCLEGGDVESEKVEGDKGVPDGGLVEMDSDQNKGEGLTVKSPNDNVETEAPG